MERRANPRKLPRGTGGQQEMNTYPELAAETVQMIQWMDALMADDE